MNKILIIKVPEDIPKEFIRKKINEMIKKIQDGKLLLEKECTHPEGCDMVKTKFICLKEGKCDN
jgi:hypothetical protein